ncbi:MAG: hypothetical protein RhofKO_26010 [Rhodothermales bacterium]
MKYLISGLAAVLIGLFIYLGIQQTKIENREREIEARDASIETLTRDTTDLGFRLRQLRVDTTIAFRALRRWSAWQDSSAAAQRANEAKRQRIEGQVRYWRRVAQTVQPDTVLIYATCDTLRDIDFDDWLRRVRPLPNGGGAGADSGS